MGACMSIKKPPFSTGRSCWCHLWPSPASSRAAEGRTPSPSPSPPKPKPKGFLDEDLACDGDERKAPESGGVLDREDFARDGDERKAPESGGVLDREDFARDGDERKAPGSGGVLDYGDFAYDSDEREAPEQPGGVLDYDDFACDSDECEALEIQLLKDTATASSGYFPAISDEVARRRSLALMEKETDEERRVQDRFRAAARRRNGADGKHLRKNTELAIHGADEAIPALSSPEIELSVPVVVA